MASTESEGSALDGSESDSSNPPGARELLDQNTTTDEYQVEDEFEPLVRALLDASRCQSRTPLGVESNLRRVLCYDTDDQTVIAIPVVDQDLEWDDATTVYSQIDSRAAAAQLLGAEAFAWAHPALAEFL